MLQVTYIRELKQERNGKPCPFLPK